MGTCGCGGENDRKLNMPALIKIQMAWKRAIAKRKLNEIKTQKLFTLFSNFLFLTFLIKIPQIGRERCLKTLYLPLPFLFLNKRFNE